MSIAETHAAVPNAQLGPWRAAMAKFVKGVKAVGVSLSRRKAIQSLGELDDRMLADMGLTRSDLRVAAQWSLWADPTDRLAELAEERRDARRETLRDRSGRDLEV
jgi:uncharacterized protein YjiS (DUF1127 family)